MANPDTTSLVSHAKINLTLDVSCRRPDGYHDIDSIVQVIDLADELEMSIAGCGVIEVRVEGGEAPSDRRNTIYKACEAFLAKNGISGGAKCVLKKRLPAQAGLGGGSGNAAAAIAALDRLYGSGLSSDEMATIAAEVGSDAPLFIYGGTVRMRGRGEVIEPLPDAPELHLLVVKPEVGVSTPWAYSEMDRRGDRQSACNSDIMKQAIESGIREALIAALANDFDDVVCSVFGDVARAKSMLVSAGAEAAMLCGSGSAVFGVFAGASEAAAAANALCGDFPYVVATRTLTRKQSTLVLME